MTMTVDPTFTVAERVLPHSEDAEASVLGVALVSPGAWPRIASVLEASDFYRESHRRIFRAMSRLVEQGIPIDFIPLRDALRVAGELEEIGGPAYLSALDRGFPKATNVEFYARVVREKARLRSAIYTANGLLTRAYAEDPIAGMIEDAVRRLSGLADQPESRAVRIGAAVNDYITALDTDTGLGLETGLRDLDDLVGGLQRRHLTIVAARPSVGKTSWVCAVADAIAGRGIPAGIVSLEMSQRAWAAQLLAAHSHVPSEQLRRKMVGDRQWATIAHALETLNERPLFLVEEARTLTQVAAWGRRLRDEHGVQILFVDYLQLMAADHVKDRQQEIAYLSRGLKRLAEDLDLPVVALSQLSRAPEQRTDKRPQLSDLRESGSIEQDADLVLLLFREEMYKPKEENAGIAEVIVAKNRSGPTGTVKVCFLKELALFCNLAAPMY